MAKPALRLVHPRTGRVLADRLQVPRTFLGRGVGLMFRRRLEAGAGMWIKPCSGIHMLFMNFAIDALFLDRENRVVRLYARLGRWRLVPLVRKAHSVVEQPAGSAAGLRLEPGEPMLIEPIPA